MGLLSWFVFGALAGWLAAVITGLRGHGCLVNMVIGVLGAYLGGFIFQIATGQNWQFTFDLSSFAVAVLGSVLLVLLISLARKGR